jgi:hypothetical protein
MVSVGLTATSKDPAVYVKGGWNEDAFVAGGFWVDDFVGIGSGKKLDALAKGIDEKYRITGTLGAWDVAGARSRSSHHLDIAGGVYRHDPHPVWPGRRAPGHDSPRTRYSPILKGLRRDGRGEEGDVAAALQGARRCYCVARAGDAPRHRLHCEFSCSLRTQPGTRTLGGGEACPAVSQRNQGWRLTLGGHSSQIAAYTDADWGSHTDDRRSIGAYLVKIGEGVVSWKSKKQTCVALSSTEAEYMALCQAAKEAVWMRIFLKGLGVSVRDPVVVNVDNQGGIALAKNPVFHDRSKHIDIQYHFTRELVKDEKIHLQYAPTADMVADLLTKSLPRVRHELLSKGIGLRS